MALCAETFTRHEEMDANDEEDTDEDDTGKEDNEHGNDDERNEYNYRNTKHNSDVTTGMVMIRC